MALCAIIDGRFQSCCGLRRMEMSQIRILLGTVLARDLGIFSISLDYSLSGRTDEYGNVFRYKAHVNKGLRGPSDVGKTAYDVFLVTQ
jgi:hypothetical protein